MSNRWLPWLMYQKVYVVSDMARRHYYWRPDFVSPSKFSTRNGTMVARGFLGNPGYTDWVTRPEPWNIIIAAFWPDNDLHSLARQALQRERTLVIHLMGVESAVLQGAVNIPPMLHEEQIAVFRHSLQKGLPMQYIGKLPKFMLKKWRPFG